MKYSSQTVLSRLAIVLKKTFHIESHAQRDLLSALARHPSKASFPALRGSALGIRAGGAFNILPVETTRVTGDVVVDPDFTGLSTGFGLKGPIRQLRLFPAVAVR